MSTICNKNEFGYFLLILASEVGTAAKLKLLVLKY